MKSRIGYSRFAVVLTAIVCIVLFISCIATVREEPAFFCLLVIYLVLLLCALFCAPLYIKASDKEVVLGSILHSKKIPVNDIESISVFQPTMGAIRICASGGFMGYWGLFREGDVGKYYGFYGKASDCFIIRMKNGRQYVVSCENPTVMIDYINSHLNK